MIKKIIAPAVGIVIIVFGALGYFNMRASSSIVSTEGHRVIIITQKGQKFHPEHVNIKRGDIIEIYNNDGNFLHHAYISQQNFNYDSGDQLPGSRHDIAMVKSGIFTVLCGIHPQMHLKISVR